MNNTLENLNITELETINGGGLSDSSTWGSMADMALNFLPNIFGRSTFLGVINADAYLKYRCVPGQPCMA